ncbi:hypothetical protein SDC9_186372 [bioreactor metagenome]|uniref:Uncharacterized protein n=1 Tax=bioreactor metagenome TaxID=1076179 RepID=A0A645HIR2_9ZZZZ
MQNGYEDKSCDAQRDAKPIFHVCANQRHNSGCYHRRNRNANAIERAHHDGVIPELHQHRRDKKDCDNRRGCYAEDGGGSAAPSAALLTNERRGIHADDTGHALRKREHIHQLILRNPAAVFDNFVRQKRQHGISAAKHQRTDFEKRDIQRNEILHIGSILTKPAVAPIGVNRHTIGSHMRSNTIQTAQCR